MSLTNDCFKLLISSHLDNDDNELIDEMIHFLKDSVNSTNVFLISFNGEQDRLDSSLQQMIRFHNSFFFISSNHFFSDFTKVNAYCCRS